MESVGAQTDIPVAGDEHSSSSRFDELLDSQPSSEGTYFLDTDLVSSPDSNQFVELSRQLEKIVESAGQRIDLPDGASLSPEARASAEAANAILQVQGEIVRLTLTMETASATKQSVQTLFNMQQ